MANISDQKLLSGRTPVIGQALPQVEITDVDPVYHEGSFAYGDDGIMYYSNGEEWTTSESPPIRTPSALAPTKSKHHRQLRLTKFLVSSGFSFTQEGVVFDLSLTLIFNPATIIRYSITSTTASSYDITLEEAARIGLVEGQVYYWQGKYLASDGQESGYSKPQALVFPKRVDTPTPITRDNTRTNLLAISPYASAFDIPGVATVWELTIISSGVKQLITNNENTLNTLNYISADTAYSWRAKYKDAFAAESDWSVTRIAKQVIDINTPQSLNAPGIEVLDFKLSDYSSISGTPYFQTDWEVYANPTDLENNISPLYVVTNKLSTLRVSILLAFGFLEETAYYWRGRYRSTMYTESDFSELQAYIQPTLILRPTAAVPPNTTLTELEVNEFQSSLGLTYAKTVWKIYNNSLGIGSAIYTAENSSNTLDILGVPPMKYNNSYYWQAKFVATTGEESKYSFIQSYIHPSSIVMPTITSPSNGAVDIKGPDVSFISSPFNVIGEPDTHITSDWEISKTIDFTNVRDSAYKSSRNKTTWTALNLESNTIYYVRVRYTGRDTSIYSTPISFTTAGTFLDVIPFPEPTPTYPGAPFQGGFYAGMVWNSIVFSSSTITIAKGRKNFAVPDQAVTPLVYVGQEVEVRSVSNVFNKMIGTVVSAGGTQLIINVTSTSGQGTWSDWSVQGKYRIILAPKYTEAYLYYNASNLGQFPPILTNTVIEGKTSTDTLAALGVPQAQHCTGLVVGSYTDWYLPSRDELEVVTRNLRPQPTYYTAIDANSQYKAVIRTAYNSTGTRAYYPAGQSTGGPFIYKYLSGSIPELVLPTTKIGLDAIYLPNGTNLTNTNTNTSATDLLDSDFTIEFYYYPLTLSGRYVGLLGKRFQTDETNSSTLYQVFINIDKYEFMYAIGTTTYSIVSSTTCSVATWNHVAITRKLGNLYLHINGVLEATNPISGSINARPGYQYSLHINQLDYTDQYNYSGDGLFDEIRISKGIARYTAANFIPSTVPFIDTDPYTVLLLHGEDNKGPLKIKDSSKENATIVISPYTNSLLTTKNGLNTNSIPPGDSYTAEVPTQPANMNPLFDYKGSESIGEAPVSSFVTRSYITSSVVSAIKPTTAIFWHCNIAVGDGIGTGGILTNTQTLYAVNGYYSHVRAVRRSII